MLLVCHLIEGLKGHINLWMEAPHCMSCHDPANFGGYRYCGSIDKMFYFVETE